ncbi:MAG: winged helix-turn-helix domain-containing protein, partial [Deltaproteobacteria bacterium]|nr:winged helix-turn-helix domain-containing protein [Deltaproteobacteria bacterium]
MPELGSGHEIVAFGSFELDTTTLELRRSGARIKLRAQPARLLQLLLNTPGEVVDRDAIRAHLWPPDTHVDFARGINACIKTVRAALRDDAQSPRFIETVPGVGYRFVAPVEQHGASPITPAAGSSTPSIPVVVGPALATAPAARGLVTRSRLVIGAVLGAGLVLAIGLAVGLFNPAQPNAVEAKARADRPAVEPAEGTEPSPGVEVPIRLAVLPFTEAGVATDDGHLGDALAWELIAELSRRHPQRLKVIALSSARLSQERGLDTPRWASTLDVSHVVRGALVHADDRVRLTMTLSRVDDDVVVWARTHELGAGDLAQLHTTVGDDVVHALALELLARPRSPSATSVSPVAYSLYLRARAGLFKPLNGPLCRSIVGQLDESIAADPRFAPAHAALARARRRCIGWPAHERFALARKSAQRAFELDPSSVEAHMVLGWIAFDYDLDAT